MTCLSNERNNVTGKSGSCHQNSKIRTRGSCYWSVCVQLCLLFHFLPTWPHLKRRVKHRQRVEGGILQWCSTCVSVCHLHLFTENSAWRVPNVSATGTRRSFGLYLLIIYTIKAVISSSANFSLRLMKYLLIYLHTDWCCPSGEALTNMCSSLGLYVWSGLLCQGGTAMWPRSLKHFLCAEISACLEAVLWKIFSDWELLLVDKWNLTLSRSDCCVLVVLISCVNVQDSWDFRAPAVHRCWAVGKLHHMRRSLSFDSLRASLWITERPHSSV